MINNTLIGRPNAPIKAVIFDMDGTLIFTEHIWPKVTLKVLFDRGITSFNAHQQAVLDSHAGSGLEKWAVDVKKEFNLAESIQDLIGEVAVNAQSELVKVNDFIPGFFEFHAFLKMHNLPLSIATNADTQSFKKLIDHLQFKNYFGEHLYNVDHVGGKAKPDPSIFLFAAQQLGVRPEECLVFEDSMYGFRAAAAAGMRCIGMRNEKNMGQCETVEFFVTDYHHALVLVPALLGVDKETTTPLGTQQAQ